jgi:putative redox protein
MSRALGRETIDLMTMTATAVRLGDGLTHEVDVNGRHTILTDEPERLGGADRGPAPHELLAAAVAACTSTMVAMYASRHGWALGELAVEVDYDPDAVPRRFDVRLSLPAGLSAEQVSRLRRVADTCPVRRALEAGCAFEEQLLTQAGAAGAHAA